MITRAIEMEPFRILIYFAYIHSNGVAIFVGVFLPPFCGLSESSSVLVLLFFWPGLNRNWNAHRALLNKICPNCIERKKKMEIELSNSNVFCSPMTGMGARAHKIHRSDAM